jgi:signal transduction histidine kinase
MKVRWRLLDKPYCVGSSAVITVEVHPVRTILGAIGKFWSAEEVPRWFGLSLVLVYLFALGGVAHFGISQARSEGEQLASQSIHYSLRLLAREVAAEQASDGSHRDERATMLRRKIQDFASAVDTKTVRIIDTRGEIIASTNDAEVGLASSSIAASGATRESVAGFSPIGGLLRVPIPGRPPSTFHGPMPFEDAGATDQRAGRPHLIEVLLPTAPRGLESLADQAGVLTVILLGLAVLFVSYRRLRGQLRPVSRIAQRLQLRREHLLDDLASLRVTDTIDTVSSAWNELVELAQRLNETVERTQANTELSVVLKRTSGGELHEALHALPDGLIHIVDEVRFEYINTAAGHLLGWNVHDRERPALADARSSGIGQRALDEIRGALMPDGNFDPRTVLLDAEATAACDAGAYRLWLAPVRRPGRQGECVVVIRDVSQQVRADRAREEFIAQVTHELRTPLTNIRAYAETLSSGMFDDPKVISECYNVITKETRRLSRLIEDVLSVSQFEVGSLELQIDQVDLKALLTEAVRDVRGLADEKSIDVQLVIPAKVDSVRADRDKLAVVVNNLLGNAIKYTKPGGNVVVGCQFAADNAVVTVKDNGIGIDPADHQRVFEKFQRGSDPDALAETGTGIGLYTVREIVRGHGGEVELISQKGQGSTFMVRLPHQAGRAAAVSAAEEK